MILVSVSDYDTAQLILVLFNISEIGHHKVNAKHFLIRKCQTAVHDKHIVRTFVNIQVLSYFV